MEQDIKQTLEERQAELRMKLAQTDDNAEKMALHMQMFALDERLARIQ